MNTKHTPISDKTFACETCQMRKKVEANPKTFMARLWPGTPTGALAGKLTRHTWLNNQKLEKEAEGIG